MTDIRLYKLHHTK